jgi:hypothetical protein
LQANLVSRDFVMRELPWAMNVSQEEEFIDVERMRDSLSGSLASLAQAIPQMASQGQDPSDIVRKMALVIDKRRKGQMIEDAVMEAFAPPAPVEAPAPAPEMPMDQMLAAMGGGMPMEATTPPEQTAVPPEAAPAEAGPTPPPDIASILASMGGQ